jgi:hypothetical protein
MLQHTRSAPVADDADDMPFRRLLKNSRTGLYYDGRGGWTAKVGEAFDYKTMYAAVVAAMQLNIDELALLMKFQDSRMDVETPLNLKELSGPSFTRQSPRIIISLLPFAVEAAKHLKQRLN